MIQVRNVPDAVHGTLKARAEREGMSLSEFLNLELKRVAERPSMREWLDSTNSGQPLRGKLSTAEVIRELRDSR